MKILSFSSLGVVVTLGAFLVGACGSEVNGSGGAGSSSSSGSGGSSSGDPAQDCADTCHKLETLNCTFGGDCNMECADRIADYPSECAEDVAAYFSCLVQNTTSCDFPAACSNFETALDNCKSKYGCSDNGTCFGGMGMSGEASCGCEDTCKDTDYKTDCTTPAGGGMTTCDCLVDNMSVGMCQQADANACGIQDSCCNAMYFKL